MKISLIKSLPKIPTCLSGSLVATLLLLSSCDNNDPAPVNEEELVTTVNLIFQALDNAGNASGTAETFTWRDLDGTGPNAPVVEELVLKANTTYQLSIKLLNESNASSIEDITEEVEEEAEEHQFFFISNEALTLFSSYDDEDANNFPIGLRNIITTENASNGMLTVILRHEPQKEAAGVADGNITNAEGETDVEAMFSVSIN